MFHFFFPEFTRKLKSSIQQQTDDLLPRKGRKIRTDDIFTNMTIQRDPERFAQTEQAERSDRKREYMVKSKITLLKKCSEIFICPAEKHVPQSKVRDSYPKFILLIGKAGIGKSLFCRKIVRDWGDDKLFDEEEKHTKVPDFQFVFLLTFRQLNSLGDKSLTLKEILKHSSILDDHSVIDNGVFEMISENPEKLLIILDGYDEYAYSSSVVGHFEENYQNDPKEKMPVPAWIAKLLKRKIWKNSVVLVTSRPGEASTLAGNVIFDAKAEIKGFSSRQVVGYVKRYFINNEPLKNVVLGHIVGNENLVRFGHIPVMCFLMCYYMEWQITKARTRSRLPQTRTDLYHKVINVFIKEHHAYLKVKREITEEEVQEIINRLAAVAVKLTEKKKFSFNEYDLRKLGVSQEEIDSLKASGLLDCWPSFFKRSQDPFGEIPLEYTFTHLTIQEYLSAFCYVQAKMIPEKDKTTSMTLVFVAEMLSAKRDKKLLKKLLKTIEPKDETDDTNRLLTLRCLQEFGDQNFATRRIVEQYEKFCNEKGWIVFRSITDMDCLSIAYLFGIIRSLKEDSDRQLKLFKKSYIVNTLFIFNSTLSTSGVQLICDSLADSTVTELELSRCGLDDSHCVQIIKGLCRSKVTILNLPYNHIAGENAKDIRRALLHKSCHVKSIKLCGNRLTEECKSLLSQSLGGKGIILG